MAKGHEDRIKKEFGERLKSIRRQKGLSQEALAFACDLDRSYVGGVERGERNISLINIRKLARALGVPPSELLTVQKRGAADRS
jgi:transcriptional regulator with XRE-family HTH domain